MPEWKTRYPGVEALNVAVMGCIVNGPGESSTPISASRCPAPAKPRPRRCSSTARKSATLRGPTLAADFKTMVIDYIEQRYGGGGAGGDGGGVDQSLPASGIA